MRAVGLSALRVPVLVECVVAIAILVSGCSRTSGTNNEAVTVEGSTLSIYVSQPPRDTGGQAAVDVVDAEKLAFDASAASKIDGYSLAFHVVRDDEVSADARAAISDKSSIAYLGEVVPGTSGVSVQITNELGLLEVSPTDTAVYLTRASPAVKHSPGTFYPAHSDFGPTFARVVPTTIAEARALVTRMKDQGVKMLDIADDGSQYGVSVAAEVRSDASAAGISVTSGASGADGVLYAGEPGATATHALDAAIAAAPTAKLFAPSALYDDTFVGGLSSAAQKALTVSSPGFLPSGLNAPGREFERKFQSLYHHAPAPEAIFGYEAMRAVLASITEAGSHAAVRQIVVRDFRDLKRSAGDSVLGAYTIAGGDTNIAPFVFAGVSGGKLVPRAAG
jgi:branched-chain amino acid transport system substrate-binding protein